VGLDAKNDNDALNLISSEYDVKIPDVIANLFEKEVVHLKIVQKSDIMREMLNFLDS
jgi:hypothetical protein